MEQLRFDFAEGEGTAYRVPLDAPLADDLILLMAAAIAAVAAKGADDHHDGSARFKQDHAGAS